MAEDEEAVRRAAEDEQKDRATKLPERIKFKSLRQLLELLNMLAFYADTIRERIEKAMTFVSMIAEMLDVEPATDKEAHAAATKLHNAVVAYRRPRFVRSLGVSADGIPVRRIVEPGAEKTVHQFLPSDYQPVVDLMDEARAEHYISDVLPWLTVAAQIARKREYLRAEGETLGFLTDEAAEAPEKEAPEEEAEEEQPDDDDEVFDVEEDF